MGLQVNPPGSLSELRDRLPSQLDTILRRSAELGFLGRMPIPDQIDHALGFVFAAESEIDGPPGSVLDLGTGGGVPGLVLLSCWPDCRVVLLDASERRTGFLAEQTADWRRNGPLEVVRDRAESVGRDERFRQQFELVVSRSFGVPAVTAECAAPLLSPGGGLIVSEPPEGAAPDRWPSDGLALLGLRTSVQARFDGRFSYQVLVKDGLTPDAYPRRVGIPAKRPLF
ncbi:MAG: class I SAM-dependent methyltransferase [Acidimicrobiales bacterium]|nr:class I SAM-dependent methyltransferase [Acidimicrobiales bacterium]